MILVLLNIKTLSPKTIGMFFRLHLWIRCYLYSSQVSDHGNPLFNFFLKFEVLPANRIKQEIKNLIPFVLLSVQCEFFKQF